jgi:hypothetical protein
MRNRSLLALFVAMALPVASACAEPSHGGKRPVFTVQDQAVIERNATVKGLVDRDPWLVRRILDAIAAAEPLPAPGAGPSARSAIVSDQTPAPTRNPDLDHLERSSPEAAHDLFQLIKKASGNRKSQQR